MICHKNHVYLIQRHILCFLAALRCFFFSLFVCSGFSPLFFFVHILRLWIRPPRHVVGDVCFYYLRMSTNAWDFLGFLLLSLSLCVGRFSAYAPLHPHKDALHTHICPAQDVCHRNHCVKVWKVVDIYLLHRIFFSFVLAARSSAYCV